MMRLIACSLIVLGFASISVSEEVVREVSWAELDKAGGLLGGEVQPDGTLKIENAHGQTTTVAIAELKEPGITAFRYAVTGKVKYEDVEAESFLEMWNYFPNGGFYFSRTLGEGGPMGSIQGTSDWRGFSLPFFSEEGTGPPDRLELNVVLGGRGTVYLSPVQLVQFTEGESPMGMGSRALSGARRSEGVVREISWAELDEAGGLLGGQIQPDGTLKIENADGQTTTVAIANLQEPGITALRYAITGKVKYEDVEAESFLEMWNYFPNGGAYFSRALGKSGPMGSIQGTSDWRGFSLPFFSDEGTGPPDRLELNVVLGGRGTVYLSPTQLVQFAEGESPMGMGSQALPGTWWSDRTGNLIGSIGGCVIGLLGGLIGTLAGLGKARRLVVGTCVVLIVLGVICLFVGVVALAIGQPNAVYYPLLLGGGLTAVIIGAVLPTIRRRYEEAELRRMTAMDIGAPGGEQPEPSS